MTKRRQKWTHKALDNVGHKLDGSIEDENLLEAKEYLKKKKKDWEKEQDK